LGACLAAGAQDYIPKRFAGRSVGEGRRALFGRFARLAKLADWVAPLREVGEAAETVPGTLVALQVALAKAQDVEWRAGVRAALAPSGSAAAPPAAFLLEAAGSLAATAWGHMVLAAHDSAPDEARPLQHQEAWLGRLCGSEEHGRAHLRAAIVALGNVFEPLLDVLLADHTGRPPAEVGAGYSRRHERLWNDRHILRGRLEVLGADDLAGSLDDCLRKAGRWVDWRGRWEHAKERRVDIAQVGTPAQCAEMLRGAFWAGANLARASAVLIQ
jgi:hypothetical protein